MTAETGGGGGDAGGDGQATAEVDDTSSGWATDRDDGTDERPEDLDVSWVLNRARWFPGLLYGAGAFLVGYVATWGLLIASSDVLAEGSTPAHLATGWVFQGEHHVAVGIGGGGQNAVAALYSSPGYAPPLVPSVAFYLLPVLVLTGTGFLLTRRLPAPPRHAADAAVAGASVAVGYLVLSVLTSLTVFTFVGGFGTTSADLFEVVTFMGLAYPVACGALGGYLGER